MRLVRRSRPLERHFESVDWRPSANVQSIVSLSAQFGRTYNSNVSVSNLKTCKIEVLGVLRDRSPGFDVEDDGY